MQKLTFRNSLNEEIDLTSNHFGITNWKGFDNTGMNIQTQTVPFYDGSVYIDSLLNNRELSVTLAIQDNNDLSLRYELRRLVISMLNPKLGEGYLIYKNDYLEKRIKVIPQIPLFQNKNSNTKGTLKASLSFTACNPYWEDLEETTVILKSGQRQIIKNEGDVKTPINIKTQISEIQNPTFSNKTQNKQIALNGNFYSGLEINTEQGNKYIKKENLILQTILKTADFKDICYSKRLALYVAVGDGYIAYSENLTNWTPVNSVFGSNKVVYSEDLNLFITNEGCYSNDGINWVIPEESLSLMNIEYIPFLRMFVGMNDSNKIYTTNNGIIWNIITVSSNRQSYNICYSDSVAVVGSYKSTNGADWELIQSASGSYFYCNGYFIFGSTGNFVYSTDLIDWSENVYYDGDDYTSIEKIIFDNGYYYIYTTSSSPRISKIYQSSDLTNFELKKSGDASNFIYDFTIYNKKIYICSTNSRKIYSSGDLVTWGEEYDFNFSNNEVEKFYIFLDKLYMSGDTLIYKNTEWEVLYKNYDFGTIHSVIQNGNITIACANRGCWVSKDLINWDTVSFSNFDSNGMVEFWSCIYANGLYVAVGYKIITSTDGYNWTERWDTYVEETQENTRINTVIYVQGKFIAMGGLPYQDESRARVYSVDGITWNVIPGNPPELIGDIAYSPDLDLFIALAYYYGGSYKSVDGLVWESIETSRTGDPISLYWNDDKKRFEYSTNYEIHYSYDGTNWEKISLGISEGGTNWEKISLGISEGGSLIYSYTYKLYFLLTDFWLLMSYDLVNWVQLYGLSYSALYSGAGFVEINNDIYVGVENYMFSLQAGAEENAIESLTENSDMNLGLNVGDNELLFTCNNSNVEVMLTFRQKYIGV